MNRRSGVNALKKILRSLRGNPQWLKWTDSRRFQELEQALEEMRPGLLSPFPDARIAYLRKATDLL